MIRWTITFVAVLILGCATSPIPISEATPVSAANHLRYKQAADGTVPVLIRRDSGLQAGACSTRVFVNGELAAYIRAGELVTLHIPAGDVILGADAAGICAGGLVELQAKLIVGRPAHYRIGYGTNGALGLFATATR